MSKKTILLYTEINLRFTSVSATPLSSTSDCLHKERSSNVCTGPSERIAHTLFNMKKSCVLPYTHLAKSVTVNDL